MTPSLTEEWPKHNFSPNPLLKTITSWLNQFLNLPFRPKTSPQNSNKVDCSLPCLRWHTDRKCPLGISFVTALIETGYLISHWNVPVFSQGAVDTALQDKTVYKTLIRLVAPYSKAGDVMAELTRYYNWNRLLIVSPDSGLGIYSARAIFSELSRLQVIISAWITFKDSFSSIRANKVDEMMETIRSKGRSKYS